MVKYAVSIGLGVEAPTAEAAIERCLTFTHSHTFLALLKAYGFDDPIVDEEVELVDLE